MNTRRHLTHPFLRVAGAAALLLSLPAFLHAGEPSEKLKALVNTVPDADPGGKHTGPDPATAMEAIQGVLADGKANIVSLVNMLKDPSEGEDYKAHYLLHAVGTHVKRPGAEDERRMVCEALCSTLDDERPTIVKAHVLEELKWIGGEESIPAISKFLTHPELYDFAVQALVARKAAAPMRSSIAKAKGRNRVALVQAMGTLRDTEAVPALIEEAKSADPALRLAAIEALANIGDARAVDVLLDAAELKDATYTEMKCAEAVLRLAQHLADAGDKKEAKRIYLGLPKLCPDKAGRHIRIAALRGLAAVADEEIFTELLAALSDPDLQVRVEAARTAKELPGGAMVDKWLGFLKGASTKDRIGVLFVLGAIGDAKALPTVLKAMDDTDWAIRAEAMRAAGAIGGEEAAQALTNRVLSGPEDDRQPALQSLIDSRGDAADKAVGAAVAKASDPAIRASLVDVIAARRTGSQMDVLVAAAGDKSADVRKAAARALEVVGGTREAPVIIKMLKTTEDGSERKAAEAALLAIGLRSRDQTAKLILPAIENANADAAAAMCRVLGRVGGKEAAETLTACAKSTDPTIKDEAIRALTKWSEGRGMDEAAAGLLGIAKTAKDAKRQVMALRGYINLARSRHWRRNDEKKVAIYAEALAIAKRPDEKRAVLGGLTDVRNKDALVLAATCLDDADVAEEAASAVVRIAGRLANKTDDAVQTALQKVMKVAKNKGTLNEARKHLIKDAPKDPLK